MDRIASWEANEPEGDDATVEEEPDYDEFMLEKLRQRGDIAADKIPTKGTLVDLGLENVFEEILCDLRESEVGELDENTLELIALCKVSPFFQGSKNDMNSSNTTYHYQAVCIRILFSKWKAYTDNPSTCTR